MPGRPRRAGFANAALLAIAMLAMGAIGHFAHHLIDTHCEEDRNASHSCACSVLHGAALAEAEIRVAPSTLAPAAELRCTEESAACAVVLGRYAPRAPPIG